MACLVCKDNKVALRKKYKKLSSVEFHKRLCKKHGRDFVALVCEKLLKKYGEEK